MLQKNKIILSLEKAGLLTDQWKSAGEQLVFTNGCFDLLHSGHIELLDEAKSMGTKLIVAVNSDSSVAGLKGSRRPIVPLEERMTLLGSMEVVDMVLPFDEETPYEVIKRILPHVLVKGGDYSLNNIMGADLVMQNKGLVQTVPFVEGKSSTVIIETILNRYCNDKNR